MRKITPAIKHFGLAGILLLTACTEPAADGGARDFGGSSDSATFDGAVDGGGLPDGDAAVRRDGGAQPDGGENPPDVTGLPIRNPSDPARAEVGRARLLGGALGRGNIPPEALRNLYLAWGLSDLETLSHYQDTLARRDTAYWAEFRARYGFFDGAQVAGAGAGLVTDGLPVGLNVGPNGQIALGCLACHAGPVGNQIWVGAPNPRLHLERLYDDLRALPDAVRALQARPLPEPYATLVRQIPVPAITPGIPELEGRTLTAGHIDAMGLALALATRYGGDEEEDPGQFDMGGQDAPAWWHLPLQTRMYTDGSGTVGGYRNMMAGLLGLGLSFEELLALDAEFPEIEQFMLSLRPPRWADFELPAVDATQAEAGRVIFNRDCAGCHGTYEGPDAHFPDRVIPLAEVGTDPLRVEGFTPEAVAVANRTTITEQHLLEATGGYLAPGLSGVWATAPYLHNGSVPTLAAVLDSSLRPNIWRPAAGEPAPFDAEAVGLRFEVLDRANANDFRVVDTSRPGLGAQGHTYADGLSPIERAAVLAYLKLL